MKCPNCKQEVEYIFNGEYCEKCSPYKLCRIGNLEFIWEEK